jgi:hypothetical protein
MAFWAGVFEVGPMVGQGKRQGTGFLSLIKDKPTPDLRFCDALGHETSFNLANQVLGHGWYVAKARWCSVVVTLNNNIS